MELRRYSVADDFLEKGDKKKGTDLFWKKGDRFIFVCQRVIRPRLMQEQNEGVRP